MSGHSRNLSAPAPPKKRCVKSLSSGNGENIFTEQMTQEINANVSEDSDISEDSDEDLEVVQAWNAIEEGSSSDSN